MHAMTLKKIGHPSNWTELPDRQPGPGELRIKVAACGVCRTDLHVVDGELTEPRVPIVPGHEIVGRIDAIGAGVVGLTIGDRVGVPWLGFTCGVCPYCVRGQENLCDRPLFTATRVTAASLRRPLPMHALPFPWVKSVATWSSPFCCAPGLLVALAGYCGRRQEVGTVRFRRCGPLVAKVAKWQGRSVFAFTRPGDVAPKPSPYAWARAGLADPTKHHLSRWTPPSFFAPVARW